MTYQRPRNTTANPDWFNATCALDLVPKLGVDEVAAERFVGLCGKFLLTQGDVAGQRLETCWLSWQRAVLKAAFQVRESFLLMGKGSSKSVTVSAYAIGFTMFSHLEGINTRGLVAILASSIPTARIVFDHIQHAILSDPELRPQFKTNVQSRSITHIKSGIMIQILACSMDAAIGRRPCLLIVDELHEVAKINGAKQVIDQLRFGGRNWGRNFKTLCVSTMPPGSPEGEFARLLGYAQKVRDGVIEDDDFLPLLYMFPVDERPDLDVLDPAQWWRGMPSLTTDAQHGTMDADELRRELKIASQAEDAEGFEGLLSQRLGIEKNLRLENAESVLHAKWTSCPAVIIPPPRGAVCGVGVDAGGVDDPAAIAVVYQRQGITYASVQQFLTRSGYARGTDNLREIYDLAVKAGTLHLTDTIEQVDEGLIKVASDTRNANNASTIIGGDEHGRAGLKTRFEDKVGPFTSVPQNYLLGASLAALEGLLIDGTLRRAACPLLDANVVNLLVEDLPSGNRRLKKRDNLLSGQGQSKIDGLIAIVNALHLLHSGMVRDFDVARFIA